MLLGPDDVTDLRNCVWIFLGNNKVFIYERPDYV